MKKLLRKLFLYLFKEDFKRMKALERDLEGLIHRQKCATSLAEEANVEIVELDKDFSLLLTFLNSKTECTLFSHDLNFPTLNGASLYGLEREARKVVGVRSKSARTGRKARLEKLIDERNNVLYQSRDSE